jgi:hypothetical protein
MWPEVWMYSVTIGTMTWALNKALQLEALAQVALGEWGLQYVLKLRDIT